MLFALSLLATQTGIESLVLRTHIASVTIFKPGLVLVTREAAVPPGTHLYTLDRVPQALDGTLWCNSPDGAKVSELKTTLDLAVPGASRKAGTIPEVLAANVGKKVSLPLKEDRQLTTVAGTLLRFDPATNTMTLRLPTGHMRSVAPSMVIDVDLAGLKTSLNSYSPAVHLQFQVNASAPSHVRFMSLETGAAWVANYRLDLSGVTGHVQAMAQMGLGSLRLDGTRVRLATGLPQFDSATKLDMATGAASLRGFLDGSQQHDFSKQVDPYDLLVRAMQNTNLTGGTGLVPNGIDFISYDPTDNSLVTRGATGQFNVGLELPQFLQYAIKASRLEDIHLFEFGDVTLPAGGRLSRILSEADAPVKTVYRWQASPGRATDPFTRTLKVHNDTGTAWPAGSVFVLSDEVALARLPMALTAPGQDATLEWGSVEDLLHDFENQVVERHPVTPRPDVHLTEVTNESTFTVTNTRPDPVDIEVEFTLTGDVLSAVDGTSTATRMSNRNNPVSRVIWRITLKPQEERKLVARYKEVVGE